jgi:hypothetical protein
MKFLPEVFWADHFGPTKFLSLRIEQLLFRRKRRISHVQQRFCNADSTEMLARGSIWYYQFCPTIKGAKQRANGRILRR